MMHFFMMHDHEESALSVLTESDGCLTQMSQGQPHASLFSLREEAKSFHLCFEWTTVPFMAKLKRL